MSDKPAASANASPEERLAALFANLVVQQTNMALMFLGKSDHPESGRSLFDLDSAQIMIDQLEMLQIKTKGNLSPPEVHLLEQSLMAVRMAFVEAVNAPAESHPSASNASPDSAPPPDSQPVGKVSAAPESGDASKEDESRKKFTKKYGA